jgi:nickel transport protein
MRGLRRTLSVAAAILAMPGIGMAHGVVWSVGGGAVVVEFQYTSGEPMAYAAIALTPPGNEGSPPVAAGRTDAKGRIAFLPDPAGSWTVTADDGMGHVATATVQTEALESMPTRPDPFQGSWLRDGWPLRTLLGFSLIGNLLALLRRRRPQSASGA